MPYFGITNPNQVTLTISQGDAWIYHSTVRNTMGGTCLSE